MLGKIAGAFIGSKVRSGSYGNITAAGNIASFSPTTGGASSMPVTEPMIWKTHGQLLGIDDVTLNGMMPGVGVSAANNALVR